MNTLDYILKKHGLIFDKTTRMPIEIPNIGRDNIPDLFKELGFKIGAEIGVLDGEYSEKLCKVNSELKLYCIDPWKRIGGFNDFDNDRLKNAFIMAQERLSKYNCRIIRKTSMDAVKNFEDNSLDFVYIDGDHEFKAIAIDISDWIHKIRVGGIICGHDFRRYVDHLRARCHVQEVVSAYAAAYHIRPWFVLGQKAEVKGEIRDKERSWMWVKLQ